LVALASIFISHFAYLAALSYSDKLIQILPPPYVQPASEQVSQVGIWTWGNTLLAALPWNLPLLAAVFHLLVVFGMLRWGKWLPATHLAEAAAAVRAKKAPPSFAAVGGEALLRYLPPILAIFLPIAGMFATGPAHLRDKTILLYEQSYRSWAKPEYDQPDPPPESYGMLPSLLECLGAKVERSRDLSTEELDRASVLLLLHPNQPWPRDRLERIWNFVRQGGALLVAAEPLVGTGSTASSFNEVLEPMAMTVREDTTLPAAAYWEHCYRTITHPAVTGVEDGRNRFGLSYAASLQARWPARPILVGQFGWSEPGSDAALSGVGRYAAGKKLGDLVLVAERRWGKGRVVVLGDTSPLSNDDSIACYEFTGRLLAYLTQSQDCSPQSWWRQLLSVLMAVALLALLAWRPDPWRLAIAAVLLGGVTSACESMCRQATRLLPDGRGQSPNKLVYIDAGHLEAHSDYRWGNFGLARFGRVLARNGYLPLLLPEITAERLERAGVVVCIAPARRYASGELKVLGEFVESGGTVICTVGAEEARGSRELLASLGMEVPHSPVHPHEYAPEPWPLGAVGHLEGDEPVNRDAVMEMDPLVKNGTDDQAAPAPRFYAAWPVQEGEDTERIVRWLQKGRGYPVIVARTSGRGKIVVVGDTYFCANVNLMPAPDNPLLESLFWGWLFSRAAGQKAWRPPPTIPGGGPVERDAPPVPKTELPIKPGAELPIKPEAEVPIEPGADVPLDAPPSESLDSPSPRSFDSSRSEPPRQAIP
jgi:hypothetical protein